MKSLEDICFFLRYLEYYIQTEYDDQWYKEFKDYKNSTNIDYALTDCFMSDKSIPYTAGIIIDILRMKY